MPAKLPDETRAAIAQALHERPEPERKRNDLAREFDVSEGMITKIAKEEGVTFDRAQTKNATAAAQADNARLRASTSRRFLEKANDALDQMDQPHIVFNIGGRDNVYTEHQMDRPPTGDLRNLMVVAATAFDKHLAAESHDTGDPDTSEVARLRETMREVRDELRAQLQGGP